MKPSYATQPAGILVADARPLFRCGLLQVLAQSFAAHHLHEAATADALLKLVGSQPPQLVLLSANLPDALDRLGSVLAALREVQPPLAVIVIVDPATTTEQASLRLLQQHASSLLPRTATPAEVCATVGAVLRHGRHHNEYVLKLLQSQVRQRRLPQMVEGFSARQLDVLRLVAADHSNEEIADYLCTSVRTVEYHRSQMLQKAGTRTSLGLVLFAQRHGMLSLAPEPVVPERGRVYQ